MAVTVTIDGTGYNFPQTGDEAWGDTVTSWAVAVSSKLLQRSGGSFPLSAEVDFGPSFGLKSLYYKSRNTNVANAGQVRLGNTETVSWRNAANSADLPLTVSSGNVLTFDGVAISTAATVIPVNRGGTGFTSYTIGDILFADGVASLAKLGIGAVNTVMSSTGSAPQWGLLVDANLSATADLTLSKVNGGTANRIIASSGASNRLAVLAAITNGHVLYADANGLPIGEAFLSKSRGGAGADMSSVTFPTTGTLVTRTATEALTNKDYDGGTASNTSRLTVPQATLSTLNGLTRKEATLVYANDVDRLYVDNGSILSAVGAGSGSINYCNNPDAEASTTGWATYADAAGTAPVDGTGGSPNITWTRSTSSPLEGLASFLLTKDAANRQGQGVSFDFTIASADLAKQLVISLFAQSDTSYAANDVLVYVIADPAGTPVVTQLAPSGIQKADGTGGTLYTGIVQAAAAATTYRLCLHIATTNASAYTLKVDRVLIAPSTVVFASAIGDWETTTVTGSWVSNATYAARRRRVGDSEEYDVTVTTSGAPTATALTVTLPTGRTIDTSKLSNTGNVAQALGYGSAADTGVQQYPVEVLYSSSNSVLVAALNAASTYAQGANVTATVPFTFGNTDTVQIRFIVPIVGFGSNVQVGSYDGRTVAMRANTSSTGAFTAATTIVYSNEISDTHGAYDPATGIWTCPVAGFYDVAGSIFTNSASWTAGNTLTLAIAVNGTAIATGYTFPPTASQGLCAAVRLGGIALNAGDTVRLQGASSVSVTCSGGIQGNYFSISQTPGRSTLAARDTVAFAAYKSSGSHTSSGSAQTIASWSAASFDTTGSFNATTGVFTAPIAGIYDVTYAVAFSSNSTGTRWVKLQKNGVDTGNLSSGAGYALLAATAINTGGAKIRLLAGETLQLQGFQNSGGNLAYATGADGQTFFAVSLIGP